VQNYILGSKREDAENEYRYALNGAAPLTAGEVVQMPLPDATQLALVPVGVYAPGVTTFIMTVGAGGAALNQYKDGYLGVDTGAGIGIKLRILSNTLAVGAVACTFTTYDPNPVAFDATTRFQLVMNPFAGLIITTAPPAAKVAGIALTAVPAANYFWCQTKGPAFALVNIAAGTFVSGRHVVASPANVGEIENAVADNSLTTVIGKIMRTALDATWSFIDLQLE